MVNLEDRAVAAQVICLGQQQGLVFPDKVLAVAAVEVFLLHSPRNLLHQVVAAGAVEVLVQQGDMAVRQRLTEGPAEQVIIGL